MNHFKLLLGAAVLFTTGAFSQENKKEKKTTITIVTEEDGKRTVIDTTFSDDDKDAINAFLKDNGIPTTPPLPPVPPVPPVPPTAGMPPPPPAPPAPPAPPSHPKNNHSYYFKFDMPDMDTAFEFDIDDEMEELKESLEKARVEMKRTFENSFDKEEFKEMMDDLKKELDNLKIEIEYEKDGKKKKIINKKTGEIKNTTLPVTAYTYSTGKSYPHPYVFTATSTDEPLIVCNTGKPGMPYVIAAHAKEESKAKRLFNKIVEHILN